MKKTVNKTAIKKAQSGKKVSGKVILPKKYMISPTSPKNIRYEGGNTGVSAPSYMLDDTGNPLPKYESSIKSKLQKAGKLKKGGVVKSKKK